MNDEKKGKECKLYYKAFNDDLTCMGFQYEVDKTYTMEEGTIIMCKKGFHCCEIALNCLEYYDRDARFCEVQIGSNYITQNGKTVTNSITILRELKREEIDELLTGFVEFSDGLKKYYIKGEFVCLAYYRRKYFRNNKFTGCVQLVNGTKEWYNNGQLHRKGGPAIIDADGGEEWYENGQLHREGGPAIIDADGGEEWYENGQRHREGGPAIVNKYGPEWWFRGRLHRTDGPAVIRVLTGRKQWWEDGELRRWEPQGSYTIQNLGQFQIYDFLENNRLIPNTVFPEFRPIRSKYS